MLITYYEKIKDKLAKQISKRDMDLYEYRMGFTDNKIHTWAQCAEKFGISPARAMQVVARAAYRIQLIQGQQEG